MPLCDCLFFAELTEDGPGPFVLVSAEAVDSEDAGYFDEAPALQAGGLVNAMEATSEPIHVDLDVDRLTLKGAP